jgi:hypothetical protein
MTTAQHSGEPDDNLSAIPALGDRIALEPDRRTGASEKVANAQGMKLRVFVAEEEAMAWLADGDPPR